MEIQKNIRNYSEKTEYSEANFRSELCKSTMLLVRKSTRRLFVFPSFFKKRCLVLSNKSSSTKGLLLRNHKRAFYHFRELLSCSQFFLNWVRNQNRTQKYWIYSKIYNFKQYPRKAQAIEKSKLRECSLNKYICKPFR